MRKRSFPNGIVIALALFAAAHAASAQAPQQAPAVPDGYRLNMMIRTTVIALNHANRTGNYTVLRDLAAPGFQQANTAARLGTIFTALRGRDLDLSPILFFQPKLIRQPAIAKNGLLRLTGYFDTRPERVHFDLAFQLVSGQWQLFGLAVDAAPAPARTAGQDAPSSDSPQPDTATVDAAANSDAGPGARKSTKASPTAGGAVVENRTVNNATRIDLSTPPPVPIRRGGGAEAEPEAPAAEDGGGSDWLKLF